MPVGGVLGGFLVKHTDCFSVQKLGLLVIITNTHNTQFSKFGQGAHQVKDHSSLCGRMEMEAVVDRDVDEVVGCQSAVGIGLKGVGCKISLWNSCGGVEEPGVGIVGAVC